MVNAGECKGGRLTSGSNTRAPAVACTDFHYLSIISDTYYIGLKIKSGTIPIFLAFSKSRMYWLLTTRQGCHTIERKPKFVLIPPSVERTFKLLNFI